MLLNATAMRSREKENTRPLKVTGCQHLNEFEDPQEHQPQTSPVMAEGAI
jgi:hypothetical protein